MSLNRYGDCFLTELENYDNYKKITLKGIDYFTNIPKTVLNLNTNNTTIQDFYILKQIQRNQTSQQYSSGRIIKLENDIITFFGSENDLNEYLLFTLKLPIFTINSIIGIRQPQTAVIPAININGLVISSGDNGYNVDNRFNVINSVSQASISHVDTTDNINRLKIRTYTLSIPDTPQGETGKSYSNGPHGNKWELIEETRAPLHTLYRDDNIDELINKQLINLDKAVNGNFGFTKVFNNDFKGYTRIRVVFLIDLIYHTTFINPSPSTQADLTLPRDFQFFGNNTNTELSNNFQQQATQTFNQLITYKIPINAYTPWINYIEYDLNNTNINLKHLGFWIGAIGGGEFTRLRDQFQGNISVSIYAF